MAKKAAKALAKLAKLYSKWVPADFQLKLVLLESGPCWVAQVDKHKGINRKCPVKAIKDLRKQLDMAAVTEPIVTACIYPSER